jgi:transposase-like protein
MAALPIPPGPQRDPSCTECRDPQTHRQAAETALAELVANYRDTAPGLADWLEKNVPEALAVFTLPEHHRKRMRTSNPIERSVQQELKRRTVKVRVFPGEDALLRLVSAVLVEIDEKWASDTKAYIKWECQDA